MYHTEPVGVLRMVSVALGGKCTLGAPGKASIFNIGAVVVRAADPPGGAFSAGSLRDAANDAELAAVPAPADKAGVIPASCHCSTSVAMSLAAPVTSRRNSCWNADTRSSSSA